MRKISKMQWHVFVLFLLLELSIPWQLVAQPTTTNNNNNNADNIHHLYQPREPLSKEPLLLKEGSSLQGKQPSLQSYDLTMAQNMATEHTAGHKSQNKQEVDGDASKKIIGSSVVTSVSVILNGDEPQFTDALGHKIPKPQQPSMPVQVASPIDLLNPDRYEFYTFDDNGDLVRRLMTMQEIQSIVANGDGEGPNIIHTAPIDDRDPEKNVQDIVYSVQNVLNKQVEQNTQNANNTNKIPALDTPDVSSTWAMILPAIFGNTGGEIYPEQKPQQIAMTPESELLETPTKSATEQSTKKPKPNKRKPGGQKRKTTTTTTTTEITPQIVQEELASDETVYTGIKHYQHIAANVQGFQQFSNIHMQPIYHKFPENTTKSTVTQKKPTIDKIQQNQQLTNQTSQTSKPNRTNAATKRPRPTQRPKGQKKPVVGQVQTQSTLNTKAKPLKATATPTVATVGSTAPPSSTAITSQKKKKKKPTRQPNPDSQKGTASRPTTQKRKPSTSQKVKPTKPATIEQNKTKKPLNDQITQTAEKIHHKNKTRPTKPATTTSAPSAQAGLVSQIYPGLAQASSTTESQKYVSPGYPIPSYSIEQTAQNPSEEIVINQLKTQSQSFPSLYLLQQQYQQPQIDESLDTQTEDDLKLSIGQIVQSLKQTTTNAGIITDSVEQTLKPHGYDSAESIDKLEELANKRKKPYHQTTTAIPVIEKTSELQTEKSVKEDEIRTTTEIHEDTTINIENKNNSNVIKFEPLLADVQEPVVMDLATTTEQTEFVTEMTTEESDIMSTTNEDEMTTTERLAVLLPQQVEMFLEEHLEDAEGSSTLDPLPIIADLSSEFNLKVSQQKDAIAMSDLQIQAATVASHLIDGISKPTPTTTTTTENDEIEQLITDVMQQFSENNAKVEEHNRLTNFAQLNTSFLLHPSSTSTTVTPLADSSSGQNINQMFNNLPLEDDTSITTENSSSDEFSEEETVTIPTSKKEESLLDLITLATETTTINSLAEDEDEEEIKSNTAGTTIDFSMDTTTIKEEEELKSQFEENGIENKTQEATNTIPIKLNKSEQSYVEEEEAEYFKYNNTTTTPKDSEDTNINNILFDSEQMLDTTTTTAETETESPIVEVEGMKVVVDSSKIKVNDAGTQKEVDKQQEVEMLATSGATEYAFVTETVNPINSESESTENVQILSAINNNSQETVTVTETMTVNESGTEEIFLDTTTEVGIVTEVTTNVAVKEDPYVKLGEMPENTEKPDEEDEEDQQTATTTAPSTTTTTTKRLSTLKPVSYYKQPTFTNYMQPEFPKPQTYISAQRPMQRPAALTNLMATSTVATRPPVRLDPSPSHSKGLEASTLGLEADVLEFSKLCNELAFNYWKSITSEKVSSARSLILSPFALTSMLSMVFLGARGSTSGEMNEILKLDDMVTFNPHLIFKNITDSVERSTDNDIATTAFVREIFSDRANGRILPFFKEKTQQFYAGHVEEVNFHVVNDIIRRRTNLLVKRHTMGKVQEYLRTNSVWVNGPLATISANLFQTDCSRASTTDRDGELFFQVHPTVRQRRLVPIPAVLYKTGFTAGYDTKLEATVVAFGRIQDTVSTIYVMPGLQNSMSLADNLEHLEKQLIELAFTENAWSNLLTTLMDRPGLEVQLPRFSHRSFVNASLGLQKMGLKGLFKSDFADLRGLTGSAHHDVFLSDMIQINTFSTCGEERIADHHHVEMYPAPPLRKRNKDVDANDDDTLDSSEAIIDFGSLVQDSGIARSFYDDDLLDPKYLELPLPLRPRQARVPDAPPRLRFDKPFLYFVRHNPTGIILFMGRFNPRLLP